MARQNMLCCDCPQHHSKLLSDTHQPRLRRLLTISQRARPIQDRTDKVRIRLKVRAVLRRAVLELLCVGCTSQVQFSYDNIEDYFSVNTSKLMQKISIVSAVHLYGCEDSWIE